jgi:hypothetical protein
MHGDKIFALNPSDYHRITNHTPIESGPFPKGICPVFTVPVLLFLIVYPGEIPVILDILYPSPGYLLEMVW